MIEFLSCYKVLEVLVVHSNFYQVSHSFKKMSSLFQGLDDGQYFFVVDFVILFYWG